MRSIRYLLLCLACFVVPAAYAQSFPPAPLVTVAVNPVTNKVYVAEELANRVAVHDEATGATTYVAVGTRPAFIAVNPRTNRVYVNNAGDSSLTVIDGGTDTVLQTIVINTVGPISINPVTNTIYVVRLTSVATDEIVLFHGGTHAWYGISLQSYQPISMGVNPQTDTVYTLNYGTGDARIIPGAFSGNDHPPGVSVGLWSLPFAVAVNPVTNKVYSIGEDSRGPIAVIDGVSQAATFPAPTAGHAQDPRAIALNPVTNKAYAAFDGEVIVIDGATGALAYIPVATGAGPVSIGVNASTNKVYVASDSVLTTIDGATNATTTQAIPAGAIGIGVNPVTDKVYIVTSGGGVTVVDGAGTDQPNPITTTITPLPGDVSGSSGSIALDASNGFTPHAMPIGKVYYQLDSTQGQWLAASGTGPWSATFSGLAPGSHTLHAFAVDGQDAPINTGQQSNPLVGTIASYTFTVTGSVQAGDFDFNADGKPDLIWSNTSNGNTYVWYMDGPALISDAFVAGVDPSWKVRGVADFNGDGKQDLVWRNTANGDTFVWYMDGPNLVSDTSLFNLPPEWLIQAVADFNGDGKPDFLMRHESSGVAFAWYFDNATPIGDQYLFGIDPSWKVEAVGDLDGDSQPDLLFRSQSSGTAFVWNTEYSGGTLSLGDSTPPIFTIDPVWEVVQLADWNGDAGRDLLFRNRDTGLVFVWYLSGTTLAGSDFVNQIDPVWEIVPRP